MKKFVVLLFFINIIAFNVNSQENKKRVKVKKVTKTEEEWKNELTQQQFFVLREKGTDAPGQGGYTAHFEKGTYHCAACDLQLFKSNTKYESHCGWPSFDDAIKGTVKYKKDTKFGMLRTEIICAACDGHLGHVFNDGPRETTGKRYCVNTTSINFVKGGD